MKTRLALALSFFLPLGAPLAAETGDVAPLLRRFEGLPDAETFRAHTADPVAALLTLHTEPTTPAWMRLRIYDALGRFPEPRTQVFLEGQLDAALAPGAPPVAGPDTHAAAATYLRTFPAAATDRLLSLLKHPDAQLRVTVIRLALDSTDTKLQLGAATWLARTRDAEVLRVVSPGAPAAPVLR